MASTGAIRAGRAFIEIFADDRALRKGLASSAKAVRSFGTTVGSLGRSISSLGRNALFGGATAALPMVAATKRFADFDDQMRTVKAVSQSTQQEFLRLTEVAKKLGATTSFTAVEVAGLMAELGRAGFNAQQIEAMTGAVLDLSRATGTDPVLSSGIMAATIRQFGLAATDSTRVADGLTQAANASFNSVESLGEALQYAGPVAADANLSLEETLAILGALGNVGIQGSEAGTALRRLLVLTQADAESMKKIFGVDALDANRNARPILDVLDEVNQATQNLPSGDRAKKFSEFFGLLGITAASAIGKNAVGAKSLLAGIQQATGVASRTAKEMDAGLGGSLRRLWSAVEGVAIAFGESLAPHVDFVAGKLTEFAGVVTKVLEENPDLAASIASIAAGAVALGAALVVLGPAITAVGSAFGVAATAMSVLASPAGIVALTLALADQGEAATVVGQSISDLAATWDGATADIAAAIAGIRAAIAAGDVESAMKIMTATLEAEWIRVCDFMERRADQLAEYLINKAYDIGIKWGEYTLPAMGFGIGTKRIDINSAVIGTRKPAPAAVEMSPELRAALEKVRQLTESAKAAAAAFDPSKDEPESAETKAAPWDQLIKKFIPPVEAAMQKIERTFSNGQFGGQLASQIFGTAGDQIVQVARNTGRTVDKLASIERKMGNGNLV